MTPPRLILHVVVLIAVLFAAWLSLPLWGLLILVPLHVIADTHLRRADQKRQS